MAEAFWQDEWTWGAIMCLCGVNVGWCLRAALYASRRR